MEKTVHVQYYALFRELAGTGEEQIRTRAETTAELYEELRERHGFTLEPGGLRAVVNEEFTDWTAPLADGDRVVFIPPVAGG